MFRLPDLPSARPSIEELADFAEIVAWEKGFASATDVSRYLGMIDDNIDDNGDGFEGCEDREDKHNERLESVFESLGERKRICGDKYPYSLDRSGSVLRVREFKGVAGRELYLYLLAATRLNMIKNKIIAGVDGTLLMEQVCCEAIKHYLGSTRAKSINFGTASSGGFKQRLNDLLKEIQEPCIFSNIDGEDAIVRAKDDGVDVVGWLPFADGRPGKLSIFAQVKTGTSWPDKLGECRPDEFQRKWLNKSFTVNPIRAFCVAEAVGRGNWNSTVIDAGLFFDRCRIVSCCVPDNFAHIGKLRKWVAGAKGVISKMVKEYGQ